MKMIDELGSLTLHFLPTNPLKNLLNNQKFDATLHQRTIDKEERKMQRFENLKEVLEEFMDKRQDLIEFEKELKKHKDQLTPGQVGES